MDGKRGGGGQLGPFKCLPGSGAKSLLHQALKILGPAICQAFVRRPPANAKRLVSSLPFLCFPNHAIIANSSGWLQEQGEASVFTPSNIQMAGECVPEFLRLNHKPSTPNSALPCPHPLITLHDGASRPRQ